MLPSQGRTRTLLRAVPEGLDTHGGLAIRGQGAGIHDRGFRSRASDRDGLPDWPGIGERRLAPDVGPQGALSNHPTHRSGRGRADGPLWSGPRDRLQVGGKGSGRRPAGLGENGFWRRACRERAVRHRRHLGRPHRGGLLWTPGPGLRGLRRTHRRRGRTHPRVGRLGPRPRRSASALTPPGLGWCFTNDTHLP